MVSYSQSVSPCKGDAVYNSESIMAFSLPSTYSNPLSPRAFQESRSYVREGEATVNPQEQAEEQFLTSAASLGLVLTQEQFQRFRTYSTELLRWNQRANLTAITEYKAILTRHFLDSLSVLLAVKDGPNAPESGGLRMLDVGTGAGFPGVPLRLVCPDLQLTLLESVGKKTAFLQALLPQLGLTDVAVITDRAETLAHVPAHREQYDVVVSRGLAKLATLAEYLLPFCKLRGRAITMKQGDLTEELEKAEGAIQRLGGAVEAVLPVVLPGLPKHRQLVVLRKVHSTPPAYPRRPGIPAKRPL